MNSPAVLFAVSTCPVS